MFRITNGSGFHIEFPNGVVLSTQIGAGNYSDNHDKEIGNFPKCRVSESNGRQYSSCDSIDSSECELAIWDSVRQETKEYCGSKHTGHKWLTKEMYKDVFPAEEYPDDVKGYCDMEDWLKVFEWCKKYKRTD